MNNPITIIMDKTGYSIAQIAKLMGVSRQTANNYANDSTTIPADKLFILAQQLGIPFEALYEVKKIGGPKITPSYNDYYSKLNGIYDRAEELRNKLMQVRIDSSLESCIKAREEIIKELDDVVRITKVQGRKPNVIAFGPSDAGKSTLINYLIGAEIAPAEYSPLTSVPTFLMHKDERPQYIDDPVADVIVLGTKDESQSFEADVMSLPELIGDDSLSEYVLSTGTTDSILREFGTRDGAYFKDSNWNIKAIIAFVDADILNDVTFVDVPGYGSERQEDNIGLTMDSRKFDIVFFLSQADAYLRGEELVALCNILRAKDKDGLSSLFILATHAKAVLTVDKDKDFDYDIRNILDKGCQRLVSTMSEEEKAKFKISEENGGYDKLRKRCLPFDTSMDKYCHDFNDRVEKEFPKIIKKKMDTVISYAEEACKDKANKYQELTDRIKNVDMTNESSPSSQENTEEAKERVINTLKKEHERLKKVIGREREYGIALMTNKYNSVFNEKFIVSAIERKNLKNRKSDIEDLSNYLSEELSDCMQSSLNECSEEFAEEVKESLDSYADELKKHVSDLNVNVDFFGFDYTRAFAAGLAGVSTYGALAVWASIVASGSNLGAYILVAKVVSVLSALGISVGGTAAAASFVASIGGPITIGISLAILVAVGFFGVFSGTWKKRVANRLIKTYKEKAVLDECLSTIDKYWDDTNEALEKCMESLKDETIDYYEDQVAQQNLSENIKIRGSVVLQMLYEIAASDYEEMARAFMNC